MAKQQLPKIVVICGATASGKSSLALDVAKKFNGEIIIADSRQLFEEMLIGTNSPTKEERKKVPHHLCNFLSPSKRMNVSEYKKLAEKSIADILSRKKLPILVGGTGLYIQAVVDNFDFSETKPDEKFRKELEAKKPEELFAMTKYIPESLLPVSDRKNVRRIIRALEIWQSGDKKKGKTSPKFEALQISPKVSREELYKKIDVRVLKMFEAGLEKEVRSLVEKYSCDAPALSGIGYREFRSFFEGKISKKQLTEEIQKDTRRYAKRQLTWFKADTQIHEVKSAEEAEKLIHDFVQ